MPPPLAASALVPAAPTAPAPLERWLLESVPSALRVLRARFARWPLLGLDPEDVVMEASIVALESAHALRRRSDSGFRSWFHGICVRRAIDALRRQRRWPPAGDGAAEPSAPELRLLASEAGPERRLCARELRAADARALAALGARGRSLVVLRALLDASWTTIARLADLPSAEAARKAHARVAALLATSASRAARWPAADEPAPAPRPAPGTRALGLAARLLRSRSLLMDAEPVASLGERIARRTRAPLAASVARATAALLRHDRRALRAARVQRYDFLQELLGLRAGECAPAGASFNRLPEPARRAFFDLLRPEAPEPPSDARWTHDARLALAALGLDPRGGTR